VVARCHVCTKREALCSCCGAHSPSIHDPVQDGASDPTPLVAFVSQSLGNRTDEGFWTLTSLRYGSPVTLP
jgi:hypothetical protein